MTENAPIKNITVFLVVFVVDGKWGGTDFFYFRKRSDAENFAKRKTLYGGQSTASESVFSKNKIKALAHRFLYVT